MAKKKKAADGARAMAGFVACSVLSVAAGIASVVMMFLKWVRVDLFGVFQGQYSLMEIYSGTKELKEQLLQLQSEFAALLGQETVSGLPGLDRVETVALAVLIAVGILILMQVVYVVTVLAGKGVSRPLGIAAGILTAGLGLAAIALFYWGNHQINASLTDWQAALDSLNAMMNSLGELFGGGESPLLHLQLDANQVFQITPFPALAAGLGLLEGILAR